MNQRSDLRFLGLLALVAAFAAPTAFASASDGDPKKAAERPEQAAQPAQPAEPAQPAQPTQSKKTWSDLDTDKNGSLSKAEAVAIPSLQTVFDQADANADGALTSEEYKTYLAMNRQNEGKK